MDLVNSSAQILLDPNLECSPHGSVQSIFPTIQLYTRKEIISPYRKCHTKELGSVVSFYSFRKLGSVAYTRLKKW